MGLFSKHKEQDVVGAPADLNAPSAAHPIDNTIQDVEKTQHLDDGPVPLITMRTLTMAILVAMGGFIFGYDTGQISGFLAMPVFLQRFGQYDPAKGYYFSNVRSGLITGLVCIYTVS